MPLKTGKSQKIISEKLAGTPLRQAIAIALEEARRSGEKIKGGKNVRVAKSVKT